MKITPQGQIIARGEDGVPWELYQNGYLLFKPTKEKNNLTNAPMWKNKYGKYVIAIGFTNTVYAPEDSSFLFSKYDQYFIEKLANLQYVDTNKINTLKVTNMSHMFYASKGLTILEIGEWNTSNVTDMSSMFYAAAGLTILDIGKWNTSNVTDMSGMFCGTRRLTTLEISEWDTSKVTNMALMFYGTEKLLALELSNWNITNVTSVKSIFHGADLLEFVNISNWDMRNVIDVSRMFYENKHLKFVDCSKMQHLQKIKDLIQNNLNQNCIVIIPNQ